MGKANKGDIMLGVCYKPPKQDKEADEIFYKQVGATCPLVPVEDFNLQDVCWKTNAAGKMI